MLDSQRQARQIWETALGQLQLQVTHPSYATWLKDTVGLSFDHHELLVGTSNAFGVEMLEQRMYSLIEAAVEKVTKESVQISFKVLSPGGSPLRVAELENGAPAHEPTSGSGQQRPGAALGAATGAPSLNQKYTFDSFVAGPHNELANAAAQAVSLQPGTVYNPLFIYSEVGLGKTHLLQAIGHRCLSNSLSVMYVTTEQFTNEYIKAVREGGAEAFRNKYRSVDILLIDDIQFLIGKEQTREGFFHTFNSLYMSNKQIVVTSDRPPQDLTLLESRMRSRLQGGLCVDISPPDFETRLAILRAKAEIARVKLSPEVAEYLAKRFTKNVRVLEGALNRAMAYSQLTQASLDLEIVSRAVVDQLAEEKPSAQTILSAVAQHYNLSPKDLADSRRDRKRASARKVAMFLLQEDGMKNPTDTGHLLGDRHRTTAIHARNKVNEQIAQGNPLSKDIAAIRKALQNVST